MLELSQRLCLPHALYSRLIKNIARKPCQWCNLLCTRRAERFVLFSDTMRRNQERRDHAAGVFLGLQTYRRIQKLPSFSAYLRLCTANTIFLSLSFILRYCFSMMYLQIAMFISNFRTVEYKENIGETKNLTR